MLIDTWIHSNNNEQMKIYNPTITAQVIFIFVKENENTELLVQVQISLKIYISVISRHQ